jgi:hypothetical protein
VAKKFLKKYAFSGGLNTKDSPYLLGEDEVADVCNMGFDALGKVKTRKGHETYITHTAGAGTTSNVNLCDSLVTDGNWSTGCSISSTAGTYIEGVGSVKDTMTLGETICDCDYANNAAALAAGWSGQTDVDLTIKLSGTSSIKDTRTMGAVIDNCDAVGTWDGATLNTDHAHGGTGCLLLSWFSETYKNVVTDYSAYKDDSRVSVWLRLHDVTGTFTVRLRIYTDASYTSGYYKDFTVSSSTWTQFTCLKSAFTSWGSAASWATVKRISVDGSATGGLVGAAGILMDDIEWHEKSFTGYRVTYTPASAWDWGDKEDSAYAVSYIRLPTGVASATAETRFHTDATNYFEYDATLSTTGGTFQAARADLDLFTEVLAPDWNNITYATYGLDLTLTSYAAAASTVTWYWDSMRWYESEKTNAITLTKAMDYHLLDSDAVLKLWFICPTDVTDKIKVRFCVDASNYYEFEWSLTSANNTEGWYGSCFKRQFTATGSPTWATLTYMSIYTTISDAGTFSGSYPIYYDYIYWTNPSATNSIRGIYEYHQKDGDDFEISAMDNVLWWTPDAADSSSYVDISIAAGYTSGNDWCFTTFDNYLIATNSANPPQKWGGPGSASVTTTKCTNLAPGTWPNGAPQGKFCKVFKNRLFIAGNSTYPSWIWWSKIGSADNTTTIELIPYEADHAVDTVVSGGVEIATNNVTLVCDCRNAFTATGTLKLLVEHSDDGANWVTDVTSTLLDGVTPNNGYTWVYDTTGLDVDTNAAPIATATDDDDYRYYYRGAKRYVRVSGITATDKTGYAVTLDATCDWEATAYAEVHTNDGDYITGLEVLNDALIIFKQYSTWALIGYGPDDWQLLQIDAHGTLAPKSIAMGDGVIYYLAHDGVRVFDGSTSVVISDKIRSTVQDKLNKAYLNYAVGSYFYSYYQLWANEDTGFPYTMVLDYAGVVKLDVTSDAIFVDGARITVILETGTFMGSGALDVHVEDSDDGVTFADVDGAVFDQVTTANDETTFTLTYTGGRDYIRVVCDVTAAGGGDAAAFGVDMEQDYTPNIALVYDPRTGCWTIWRGVYPNVFGVYENKLYVGTSYNPTILRCQVGYDDAGAPIDSYLQTGQLNCGVPEMRKRFHGLYSIFETADTDYAVTVTAETEKSRSPLADRLTANEARQWDIDLYDANDNLIEQRQTMALQGRYLQLKWEHEGANEPISMLGFTLEYRADQVV